MDCLLFGGAERVGKSSTIYRLALYLRSKHFHVVAGSIPPAFADFRAVLEGTNAAGAMMRIIINSPSDTPQIIDDFKAFYDANGNYDILISSVRDEPFWPRAEFFQIIGINPGLHFILEIPLAKITRRDANFYTALNWYEAKVDELVKHVLSNSPFNF